MAIADLRDAPSVSDSDLRQRAGWTAARLGMAAVGTVVVLWVIGWPLVHAESLSWLRDLDAVVSADIAQQRTPLGDELSGYASGMADTPACIAVLVIVVTTLRLWLGRWFEALIVGAAIGGELIVFLAVTGVIARDRPDVVLLDPAPPTSSYPSGHTAAAVALYGCIAVLVVRLLRPVQLAVPIVVLLWCIPIAVGIARIYRGMHHLSDVVVGVVGGGLWLLLTLTVFGALAARAPGRAVPGGSTPNDLKARGS